MEQIWNYLTALEALKELISANPRIAFYIYVICLITIGINIIMWIVEFLFDKFRPDLPYKHSLWLEKNTKEMKNLSKAITRIESRIDTLFNNTKKKWKA